MRVGQAQQPLTSQSAVRSQGRKVWPPELLATLQASQALTAGGPSRAPWGTQPLCCVSEAQEGYFVIPVALS